MYRLMVIMVKGPKGQRGWLVPAPDDDPSTAVAYFVEEKPSQEPYDALREYLGLKEEDGLPTQIEVQVSQVYFRRLAGQVFWR